MVKLNIINLPKKVIVHCSATPDYVARERGFNRFGASDINDWHKERGWSGIGYHYVVRRNGQIENGRPPEKIGAHARGHNDGTLGICYIGTKHPTMAQLVAFESLYRTIFYKYNIRWSNWVGHYELNDLKDCPGFDMELFRAFLKNLEYKLSFGRGRPLH